MYDGLALYSIASIFSSIVFIIILITFGFAVRKFLRKKLNIQNLGPAIICALLTAYDIQSSWLRPRSIFGSAIDDVWDTYIPNPLMKACVMIIIFFINLIVCTAIFDAWLNKVRIHKVFKYTVFMIFLGLIAITGNNFHELINLVQAKKTYNNAVAHKIEFTVYTPSHLPLNTKFRKKKLLVFLGIENGIYSMHYDHQKNIVDSVGMEIQTTENYSWAQIKEENRAEHIHRDVICTESHLQQVPNTHIDHRECYVAGHTNSGLPIYTDHDVTSGSQFLNFYADYRGTYIEITFDSINGVDWQYDKMLSEITNILDSMTPQSGSAMQSDYTSNERLLVNFIPIKGYYK